MQYVDATELMWQEGLSLSFWPGECGLTALVHQLIAPMDTPLLLGCVSLTFTVSRTTKILFTTIRKKILVYIRKCLTILTLKKSNFFHIFYCCLFVAIYLPNHKYDVCFSPAHMLNHCLKFIEMRQTNLLSRRHRQ